MDLSPLAEPVAAVVAAALAVLGKWVRDYVLERVLASRVGRVESAVGRAAGQIVEELWRRPEMQGLTHQLVDRGADYVAGAVPETLAKLGVPRDRVAEMVRGELGRLLAAAPRPGGTP